jgi:hypothetical protein
MAGEIIRPKDLPPKPDINPNARIAADDETRVWGPTIAEAVGQARPFATQAQAAAGTSTTATMNPLTTKQSITSEVGVSLASKAQGDKADSAVLGADFVTVGDPNPLAARLRCEKCGGRSITLILSPPSTPSPGAGYLSDAYR